MGKNKIFISIAEMTILIGKELRKKKLKCSIIDTSRRWILEITAFCQKRLVWFNKISGLQCLLRKSAAKSMQDYLTKTGMLLALLSQKVKDRMCGLQPYSNFIFQNRVFCRSTNFLGMPIRKSIIELCKIMYFSKIVGYTFLSENGCRGRIPTVPLLCYVLNNRQ